MVKTEKSKKDYHPACHIDITLMIRPLPYGKKWPDNKSIEIHGNWNYKMRAMIDSLLENKFFKDVSCTIFTRRSL